MYHSIFDRLLHTLEDDQLRICREVLKWITTATSTLTVTQLSVALAVRKEKKFDEDELLYNPRADILEACAPLVEILADDTVRIVHLTVKEFCFQVRGDELLAISFHLVRQWLMLILRQYY